MTPLRGLGSFAESERDVFFGRDQERDQLANLVTDSSYRAGLLYGESGVGRTSLLRAGLQPSLRDHGVVALFCEDNNQPLDSFAQALSQASGQVAKERETAASYLARVIGQAAQMYLFILDDIDLAMSRDERVCAEVAELFTRVASRSAGRARFLFSCASDRVHAFAALELRTGSLFPPASRFELCGMAVPEATLVLERTVALAGIPCEEDLVPAIIADLSRKSRKSRSHSNSILPCDLQIAAIAIKELGIASAAQFQREGGYTQLENRWVVLATQSTGNERSAMRLLAVLAANGIMQPCPTSSVARQANVDIDFAQGALATLQTRGLVQGNAAANSEELHYTLRHEVLAPRLRQQAAPAAISAQKAYEVLGAKAAQEKGLSRREYLELRREGIVPTTPQEEAVISKTLMRAKLALFGAAALPILVVAFVYVSMSGSYYLDTAHGAEGSETIVVRAGKPGLSWFNWLPKSPSFGSIVADTGLTSRMVSESTRQKARSHDISGSLDGAEYVDQTKTARSAGLAAVLLYAQNGDAAALAKVEKDLKNPEEFVQFLSLLREIAHGADEEVQLLEQALAFPSSALQTEALALATSAEKRHPGSYSTFIANALASSDTQRRHIAIAALRSLDSKRTTPMIQAALDTGPDDEAGQELRALLSGVTQAPSAENSQAENTTSGTSTKGASSRTKMVRAFQLDPAAATTDAIALVANESADAKERIAAIKLLIDNAPESSLASLDPKLRVVRSSKSPEVADAILPLLARAQPVNVASELVAIANAGKLTTKKSVMLARSWGQIARSDETIRAEAGAVLERLLKSEDREIRAAAAEAYGFTGRSSQEELIKIVKTEFKQVAQSAAMGLANSVEVGAPAGRAVVGINEMWKRKGRIRRAAGQAYARLARFKPIPVFAYLAKAARSSDDPSLHPIGMRGLCNSLRAGFVKVTPALVKASQSDQVKVRQIAIECVADHPDNTKAAALVAGAMAKDSNAGIRAESARVLTKLASTSTQTEVVGAFQKTWPLITFPRIML
ncbi:MAG: ATP-binding protein [Kofleriaceae bacterium]|nr:ATP-binding protein [Kofleriaceae bacterium]